MMTHRFALCGVLALLLPLTGCYQKPAVPPVPHYATPVVVQNPVIGADELYSLVSPVALYPDNLLKQVLIASTTPDEIAQAALWQQQHSTLKGKELTLQLEMKTRPDAVKSLVTFPAVLAQLANNMQWTRELDLAYSRQPEDVMNAVQTLRVRAQQSGALTTTPELRVQTLPATEQTSQAKSVPAPAQFISITPVNSQRLYVPVYSQAVFGDPAIIYYPGYTPARP